MRNPASLLPDTFRIISNPSVNCNIFLPMHIVTGVLFFQHTLYTHSNRNIRVCFFFAVLVLSLLLSCAFLAHIPIGCSGIYTYRYPSCCCFLARLAAFSSYTRLVQLCTSCNLSPRIEPIWDKQTFKKDFYSLDCYKFPFRPSGLSVRFHRPQAKLHLLCLDLLV